MKRKKARIGWSILFFFFLNKKFKFRIEAPKNEIPIKPMESFKKPPIKQAGGIDGSSKFKPDDWTNYFDNLEYTSNVLKKKNNFYSR